MEPNPRIPDFLRAVTWVECGVVAGAAGLLYTLPTWGGQDIWAWQTPPFNARYIGSIYVGALVPLLILAITARWSPGRIVLWMIFVFTTAILLVMLAYTDRFEWARFATWLFWALYVFLPVNSAVFLWRLRDLPLAGATTRGPAASAGLTLLALAMGGYGLALLAVPEDAAELLALAGRRLPRPHLRGRLPDAGGRRPGGAPRRQPRRVPHARDHAGGRRRRRRARHLHHRPGGRGPLGLLRAQPRARADRRRAGHRSTWPCSCRQPSVTRSPISQRSSACERCVFCSSATIRAPAGSSMITCVVVPT